MNPTAHQITGGGVDQAMPGDCILTAKGSRYYMKFVMAAFPGTGVAGMQVRFIFNSNALCRDDGEALAQQLNSFLAHAGSAFLKGLTVTLA